MKATKLIGIIAALLCVFATDASTPQPIHWLCLVVMFFSIIYGTRKEAKDV